MVEWRCCSRQRWMRNDNLRKVDGTATDDSKTIVCPILQIACNYVRLQPLRKVGLMNLLASALLVMRIFSLSHSSLPSKR